jgi:hypothetical protein
MVTWEVLLEEQGRGECDIVLRKSHLQNLCCGPQVILSTLMMAEQLIHSKGVH